MRSRSRPSAVLQWLCRGGKMKIVYSGASRAMPARLIRPVAVRQRNHAIGWKIERAVVSFFTHLCALVFAGITGLITTLFVLYLVGLPLSLAGGVLGAGIGEAT